MPRSDRSEVGVEVVLDGDVLLDEPSVGLVVEAEDALVDVLVVLAERRRSALPLQRDAAEGVTDVGIGADVSAGERAEPSPLRPRAGRPRAGRRRGRGRRGRPPLAAG